MKKKLTEEFKEILTNGKRWALLEVEYAKLTAAEKLTMLMSALALGAIMLMASVIILALLLLALAEVFKLMVDPWLAYICTAGVGAIIAGIIYLLRKTLRKKTCRGEKNVVESQCSFIVPQKPKYTTENRRGFPARRRKP